MKIGKAWIVVRKKLDKNELGWDYDRPSGSISSSFDGGCLFWREDDALAAKKEGWVIKKIAIVAMPE